MGVRAALLHESLGPVEEHDLDLAIDGHWRTALGAVSAAAASHRYRPILLAEYDVADSRYVAFARAEWSGVSRLAVDTCGDARGVGKYGVPMRRLLADSVVRSGVRCADPAWEATYVIAKHVWKRTASSPALDATIERARMHRAAFERAARHVFGSRLTSRLLDRMGDDPPYRLDDDLRALLRAIHVRRGLRSPLLPLSFVRRWAARTLRPNGTWIVVSGPDGSGKSTSATRLRRHLAPLFRRTLRLHWSPGLLPRPASLLGRPARDPDRPHAVEPHGRVLSILVLLYHWLDHALGYLGRIRPTLVRSGLVVMERGYFDLAVDPRRYRLNVPQSLVRTLGRLLPKPDLTILLLGDPSVLHERKPELGATEIRRQQERWRALIPHLGTVALVDAAAGPQEVLAATLEAVVSARSDELHDHLRGGAE